MVVLPDSIVTVHRMSPGAYQFIDKLSKDAGLRAALQLAGEWSSRFDWRFIFYGFVRGGAVIGFLIDDSFRLNFSWRFHSLLLERRVMIPLRK
jgi:hypothetical protein